MLTEIFWDRWQRDVLAFEGNVAIRAGRQVGKSEVISEKAVRFAIEHPGTVTMIIAASQRQSSLLFEKVVAKLSLMVDGTLSEKPTMTKALLSNGSRVYCMPTGRTGYFIRGFTLDLLIADEAAYIPESVWLALTPMIAVSRKMRSMGHMVLLSTPFGKGGFFHSAFSDPDFKCWHVSSEDCPRIPLDFLKKEKARMSKAQYRQEYLGEFTDEWNQFFPTDLVKRQMTFIEWGLSEKLGGSRFYLGVDVARYGGDENAFVVVELLRDRLKVVKVMVTDRVSTVETIGRVEALDKLYAFARVFVDDAGVGGAVTDVLISKLGRRVVGLNNASKRVVVAGEDKKRGILKEDLYSNCLMLLETGRLELLSDLSLLRSLKSVVYEYTDGGVVKIYGDYAHLAEACVRACWCLKERGLSPFIA
jgi:hypothetical protein